MSITDIHRLSLALTDAHNVDFPARRCLILEKRPWGADYGWGVSYAAFSAACGAGRTTERADKSLGWLRALCTLRRRFTFIGQSATPEPRRTRDASVALAEFILCAYRYGLSMTKHYTLKSTKQSLEA